MTKKADHSETLIEQFESPDYPDDIDINSIIKALGKTFSIEKTTKETLSLYQEMFNIMLGTSDVAPAKGDYRFKDSAWRTNAMYKRMGQGYLAWSQALTNLTDDLEDWQTRERVKFIMDIMISAGAPTNTFMGNPAAIKEALDTGGKSVLSGAKHQLEDLIHNKGMPSMVDTTPFKVGENLAVTKGSVVFRNELLELIQYNASSEKVTKLPVMVIPPQINKYYFLDLAPGKSFVEYVVSQGVPIYMVSWRNPTEENADWNLDKYVSALLEAVEAVKSISRSSSIHTMGFCAGGITMTAMIAHLKNRGDTSIESISYAVTLLDWAAPAMIGVLRASNILEKAKNQSSEKGLINGKDLAMVFSWMRPNDLVWNYWVNNYLMGKKPPSFDILAWNADSTNLPAGLHTDFLDILGQNALCKKGVWQVLGEPVDLSSIEIDKFVTAGTTDHITPWKGCFQTTQLFGGDSTFVLSNAGHIASLVNPPGNPKASYEIGSQVDGGPEEWQQSAKTHTGSWWECWVEWINNRSDGKKSAPKNVGNRQYPAIEPAPGKYIMG